MFLLACKFRRPLLTSLSCHSLHALTQVASPLQHLQLPFFIQQILLAIPFSVGYYPNSLYQSLDPENLETNYGKEFSMLPSPPPEGSPPLDTGKKAKLTRSSFCLQMVKSSHLLNNQSLNSLSWHSRPFTG